MSFLTTIEPSEAEGEVRAMYQRQQDAVGFVPNYARVFCHRPALMQAWADLIRCVREPMEPRYYELATLGAAQALGNGYCCLAHGRRLLRRFFDQHEMAALMRGEPLGRVTGTDLAVMRVAGKVALAATTVERADIEELKAMGLADETVFDIVAAAAARCFFSKINDALGVEVDAPLVELDPAMRELLLLGRPVSDTPPSKMEVTT